MAHTAIRCKRCQRGFLKILEHCPACGLTSPRGLRLTLVKWIAILVFLVSVASVTGLLLHLSNGH